MTTNKDRWIERLVRISVDFLAIQYAAVIALVVGGLNLRATPTFTRIQGETGSLHYYLHILLPLSMIFLVFNAFVGLYTKSRGYTLQYKLRRAFTSSSLAAVAVVIVCFQLGGVTQLSPLSATVFVVGTVLLIPGLRWAKDWMFHRESAASSPTVQPTGDAVLVVGGAGYIGCLVVEKLLALGYKVRLLDSLMYGDDAIRKLRDHHRLEFIEGDCRNIRDVVQAMANVRSVIHLAAIVGDPACAADEENASQINYAATRMMAEIAAGHGVERFIFASTCSVYGDSEELMDENSETRPISLYSQTKLQSEEVLLGSRSKTFHPVILRFATVFGLAPRPRFDLVVNLLTAKAIQEKVITIFNGDQWRPFIHVQDVAQAVVEVFLAPLEAVSGEIFNVGDDRLNFTLGQIANKIKSYHPITKVEQVENADRRNYRVSFQKIRKCVGFAARKSIEDGILEITYAFASGLIADYRELSYNNLSFLREKGHVNPKHELDIKVMAAFASANYASTTLAPRPGQASRRLGIVSGEILPLGVGEDWGGASPNA
jgi:nucleoside-diphosphate-sugar epimerase